MLFLVSWEFTEVSDEAQQATLNLFSKWQPGPAQFQAFYGYADGNGGCAIVEASDAATLARTVANWTPYLKFDMKPILPIQESAAIGGEALAWRAADLMRDQGARARSRLTPDGCGTHATQGLPDHVEGRHRGRLADEAGVVEVGR